jgi:hypothetical protein
VRRRDFIKIIAGSTVGWPLAVQAQQPDRMRRVSLLLGVPENDPETNARLKAFRLGMRDAGWVEGRNVHIEYRFAGANLESINQHIAELIRVAPDVIVANSTPVMTALPTGDDFYSGRVRGRERSGRSRIHFESYPPGRQYYRVLIYRARNRR